MMQKKKKEYGHDTEKRKKIGIYKLNTPLSP